MSEVIMSKAKVFLEALLEFVGLESDSWELFSKNIKRVQLKRDGKWYRVKSVDASKGIYLVGMPEPVTREEIAKTSNQ